MTLPAFLLVGALLFPGLVFGEGPSGEDKAPCHVVYDAGSTGTRLFVYELEGGKWVTHEGPKVCALADPVRDIRSRCIQDVDAITTEVVRSLETIKQDGPMEDGVPKWNAFDWSAECNLVSAGVYATAGMRIAEQENSADSLALWKTLKEKLQEAVGESVPVSTRTITGYEEGLYAWLSIRARRGDNDFGIVEMGGASSQIAFPCTECNTADGSTMTIKVKGNPLNIYSYSFLGLGQDEAPKTLGLAPACAYGAGTDQADWSPKLCAEQLAVTDETTQSIRDPYNFDDDRGTQNDVPTEQADVERWFLTGAFNYLRDTDIDDCCRNRNYDCYRKETACFRPIFLNTYLQALDVPEGSERSSSNWTLGAAICAAEQCLPESFAPVCRWMEKERGCLQ